MPLPPLPEPTDPVERMGGTLKGALLASGLFSSLVGFNVGQALSVLALPFSRSLVRRVNRWAADSFWSLCVKSGELLYGIGVEMTGDDVPPEESAIVVMNHQQMPDITFLMFLAHDKRRLGDMKWMLKDVIKYVPGVGWGLYFLDSFFVKRDWTKDAASIEATFGRIKADDIPVWLMSFVEGTRISDEKVAQSQSYARDKGIEPFQHVLLPRTKGFVASVRGLRDHVDAVYDVTIGYPDGGLPTLWQYIKGRARRAHLHVRRFPISSLPTDDDELASWLMDVFRDKDALLEHFYAHGAFPSSL